MCNVWRRVKSTLLSMARKKKEKGKNNGITSLAKKQKKEFNNESGDSEVALLVFNRKISNQIIKSFNKQFSSEGNHIKNGGKASPMIMLSLLSKGTGSLGMPKATFGQLFVATANPETLMTIGNGVGSAVMGAGRIVSQAPFTPVDGAPSFASQAISTITFMNEFKVVTKKLDDIQKFANSIIKRNEATFIGEIMSASNRIVDIENQFVISGQFTSDMMIRLAVLEDRINSIFERYHCLHKSQNIEMEMDVKDLKFKQTDAFMLIECSILDIQIDLLRMKLIIQENPGYIKKSAHQFKEKIDFYSELWASIKNNVKDIQDIVNAINETIEVMTWWQKQMPEWLGGKKEERKELQGKSVAFGKEISEHQTALKENINNAMKLKNTIEQGISKENTMSLIYWQDENGAHSYYTNDLLVQ